MSTTLAQAWKEYSLSDSRYLTSDIFVVCMETVTAVFWGPLSFVCAWCIINDRPLRHPLQSIISLGQIYGDILYLGTSTMEFVRLGVEYSRPEAYYYWGYYVFLNVIWIIYPCYLLIQSTRETVGAFAAVKKAGKKVGKK